VIYSQKREGEKMFGKEYVVPQIKKTGLMAIIRTENGEQALRAFEACVAGGIKTIEISFTVPGILDVLQEISEKYQNGEVILGAGTVLDPETARSAILAGAQFVVSPYLNTATVKLCNRYQVACLPGAMTIKEVAECMEAGADIVKIFPAELFGPAIIKAIKGPLPYAPLMPTGGVTVDNIGEWFQAGAVAVGIGSSLMAGAKQGDYQRVTRIAREFVGKINERKAL
jgi:2-dehydro-3-deoxyphosphogluconate aldolase/(4S)-4-hydroxy-2-oxoglutarate aldolase